MKVYNEQFRLQRDLKVVGLYNQGLSTYEIGKMHQLSAVHIGRLLKKYNVERRTSSECSRKYLINEAFFDKIDSEAKAYFLGFLYADGCNVPHKNVVKLYLNEKDKEILIKLNKIIGSNKPLRFVKGRIDKNGINIGNTYGLVIENKYISHRLVDLGCVHRKTQKLLFPDFLKDELVNHFVRGYFDGDGSIGYYDKKRCFNVKFISTVEFCEKLREILFTDLGVNSSLYRDKRHNLNNNVRYISVGGNKQVLNVMNWLYKDSTLFLERKHDRYCKLLNLYQESKTGVAL